MTLADIFRKKYTAHCYCNNCGEHSEVQIPKGVTITQFIDSATGKCPNCNCNTLVADYVQMDEYRNQPDEKKPLPQVKVLHTPLKRRQPPTQPLQRAPMPEPRPSNRPPNSLPPRKPVTQEPDFTPKGVFKNDVDFWTGKPQRRRQGDEDENY